MGGVRRIALTLCWLLPGSRFKNWLLTRLGHRIDPNAHAGCNLVWRTPSIILGPHAHLGRFNLIKNVREVRLGAHAFVGAMNLVSAHPVYMRLFPDGSAFIVEDHATVTSRHSIDCAGSVTLGRFCILAGRGSTILTHSIDVRFDAQTAHPVVVGERSFVATSVIILGGARLPPRSMLAAGAVLSRTRGEMQPGLWAGVPARRVGEIDGDWFTRERTHTRRVYIPATDEMVEDAF